MFRRPRTGWFVTLDGGIVLLVALAVSPGLYGRVVQRLPLPPVRALKGLLAATAVIHLGEAAYARSTARRRGLPARRWALQTFAVGFPSLLELRKMSATPSTPSATPADA
jgi:hypothetical protein